MVLIDLFWVISPSRCAWRLYNKLIKCANAIFKRKHQDVPKKKGKEKTKRVSQIFKLLGITLNQMLAFKEALKQIETKALRAIGPNLEVMLNSASYR
jgi:hypothetical protein